MNSIKKSDRSVEIPVKDVKKAYESPRLQPLGDLRELTLGSSVGTTESPGFKVQ